MSLKEVLDALRAAFISMISPEVRDARKPAAQDLVTPGTLQKALKTGDKVPDFNLPDARGGYVRLHDLLTIGSVVISFYRGGWCPYCDLQLRALQNALPEIKLLGAELVAISPDRPDESLLTAEKNKLTFPVLSDAGSATAKDFGIAYDLVEELRPFFARAGHVLPKQNGDNGWILPIPATYVVNSSGVVTSTFFDVHYRNRLEPAEIISTLQKLAGELTTSL